MAARSGRADAVSAVRSRRIQNLLFVLALLGIAGGTAAGFLLARADAREEARERSATAAATAGMALQGFVERAADALAGASAVVQPDGTLDVDAFEAYARDLGAEGPVSAVALLDVVEADEREAFEDRIGAPIQVIGPGERVIEAPESDRYYAVLAAPTVGAGFTVVGLDYRGDPARGPATEAARAAGAAVVSGSTVLPRTGERGVVVVHPLHVGGSPGTGPLAGFAATGIALPDVLDSLAGSVPVGAELALRDDGDVIAARGRPSGAYATRVDVDVPGRRWTLTVDPAEPPDQILANSVLAAGIAAGLWVLMVFVTTVRYQRRMARTHRSLSRAENRSRTLERLGSRLSQSLSGVEVAGAVLEAVPRLTGAIAGAVAIVSDDGTQLETLQAVGYDADQAAVLDRVPLGGSVLDEVLGTGHPAWLPSPLAWRDDPVVGRFADLGRAAAIVPLRADRTVGVLVLAQPNVRSFGDEERSLLTTIGALAGRALDRSLRYDADHATALAFQQASLPAKLPVLPGMEVAARYRPATRLGAVGGDWYDLLRLDDGRAAVIVGDVVGHGVDAAAAMGQLRVAVRVLAGVHPSPESLLRLLGGQVPDMPDAMCATMAYGIVDPATRRFSYLLAGHPPPVLLRASGPATLLDGEPWPPLGVGPAAEPEAQATRLGIGDRLILYTDGVVERRDESLNDGLERLRVAAEAHRDLPLEAFCDAVLDDVVPSDDQADDVALLVVTLVPDGEAPEPNP